MCKLSMLKAPSQLQGDSKVDLKLLEINLMKEVPEILLGFLYLLEYDYIVWT